MDIIIVGAGIGGLTTALCLLAKGFNVRVYERSHVLEEAGAGIQIGSNGCKVLRALGLLKNWRLNPKLPKCVWERQAALFFPYL